jgi:chaperonin GroES
MIRPLADRVIVRRVEEVAKTASGLYIPDQHKEKPAEGIVVAIGIGRRTESGNLIPLEVKAGDKVLFGKYAGSEADTGGEKLLILREEEILAILE